VGHRVFEKDEEKIVGEISISVELRGSRGKGPARRLRAAGRVPGVVYGQGKDAVAISLDPIQLERSIKGSHAGINTLFDLDGEKSVEGRTVIVKELQREPVRGDITHADFLELDLTARLNVSVPVHLEGTPQGVVLGGILEHTLREVELSCLPNAIPDELIVNVESLDVGQSLHVSDLSLPDGVELLTDPELSVASVALPKAEEEVVAAEVTEEGAEEAADAADAEAGDKPAEEGGES
jgi:large subunit ribosomal protein L25